MANTAGYKFTSHKDVANNNMSLDVQYTIDGTNYVKGWSFSLSASMYVEPDTAGTDATFYLGGTMTKIQFKYSEIKNVNGVTGGSLPGTYMDMFTTFVTSVMPGTH